MSDYDMIIIGGGIAGLAAGCYARMNGYTTLIVEKHTIPGGNCTAWKRKGFLFDGCLHDLAGTNPASTTYRLWHELGALPSNQVHHHDIFWSVEDESGARLDLLPSVEKQTAHMLALAPEDSTAIKKLMRHVSAFETFDFFAVQAGDIKNILKMLPHLDSVFGSFLSNVTRYAKKFKSPILRKLFPYLIYGIDETPMMLFYVSSANTNLDLWGWPLGGSLALAKNIALRYEDLGGRIIYGAEVKEILVNEGKACGIETADGTRYSSDRVISAMDGYSTIYQLLKGQYTSRRLDTYYQTMRESKVISMAFHVSLGLNTLLEHDARATTLILDHPITITGEQISHLDIEYMDFDPAFAPSGKSVLKILLPARYDYWKQLKEVSEQRYQEAKEDVLNTVIDIIAKKHPEIRKVIEVTDVATPHTVERFTGILQGQQAWIDEKHPIRSLINGISPILPGLKNFYLVGMWNTGMPGINVVASDARKRIKKICKMDGKTFTTNVVED